jgi:hypothetical protein
LFNEFNAGETIHFFQNYISHDNHYSGTEKAVVFMHYCAQCACVVGFEMFDFCNFLFEFYFLITSKSYSFVLCKSNPND